MGTNSDHSYLLAAQLFLRGQSSLLLNRYIRKSAYIQGVGGKLSENLSVQKVLSMKKKEEEGERVGEEFRLSALTADCAAPDGLHSSIRSRGRRGRAWRWTAALTDTGISRHTDSEIDLIPFLSHTSHRPRTRQPNVAGGATISTAKSQSTGLEHGSQIQIPACRLIAT